MNYQLSNQALTCSLAAGDALRINDLTRSGAPTPLLATPATLVTIDVEDVPLGDPAVARAAQDQIEVAWTGSGVSAELRLRLDGERLCWALDLQGASRRQVVVRFPFLGHICPGDVGGRTALRDAATFRDSTGRAVFRRADWPLPAAWLAADGTTVTLLGGPTGSAERSPIALLATDGLALVAEPAQRTVWDAELVAHNGGWPAAWDLLRRRVRAAVDLSEYRRPDLEWYGDQLVQHFTFAYGRELLNLDTGAFEIDRLLDEGEQNFGGYDGMLFWGVYPRIGVDERTQWDFYDDFPGGRAGLRAMARRARERGVRFFVPYKPWDRSGDLHRAAGPAPNMPPPAPDHDELARLVADVEADGVFLDTMSAVSAEFRAALDRARPGVVFCSEGRAKGPAFEVITGSWDQWPTRDATQGNWSAARETMPAVDLGRFVFPEHRLFVIERHATGADRIRVIQRGFFGGMGWVVWQDIFGLTLPYTPEEAALLKRCRTIFREHRDALRSERPTPLVDTLTPGVYANEFPGVRKRLWTLYNDNSDPVSTPVLQVESRADVHYVDVWRGREVKPDAQGRLAVALDPSGLGAVVELPRLLELSASGVIVREELPGAVLEFHHAAGIRSWPIVGMSLDLKEQAALGPAVMRLARDGEVLDQIVVPELSRGGAHV